MNGELMNWHAGNGIETEVGGESRYIEIQIGLKCMWNQVNCVKQCINRFQVYGMISRGKQTI